jgi:Tautomerase enzyme
LERDGDRVMMHLVMRTGRSDRSKPAFYNKVGENLAAKTGIPPANVTIVITENHDRLVFSGWISTVCGLDLQQ